MKALFSENRFAVFDLETTGLDSETDRIVQIGIMSVELGVVTEEWQTLVDPGIPIPEKTTMVHGITNEAVASAPTFSDVAQEVAFRLKGKHCCIGYNALAFDAPLLEKEFDRAQHPMSLRVWDILILVRHFDAFVRGKGRHKLDVTAKRYGVPVIDAHEAIADCRMTWAVAQAIAEANPSAFFGAGLDAMLSWQHGANAKQRKNFEAWLAKQPKREQPCES